MTVEPLHVKTKFYIAALACIAAGLTLASRAWTSEETDPKPLLVAIFVGCMALAWLFPLHFTFKTKLYVDAAVVVATILLFEPAVAMLIAGVGTFLAHTLRPADRDWTQAIFNAAQAMILAATGGLLLAAAGWDTEHPAFAAPGPLLLLAVAGVVMHVLSVLGVATVVALEARQPILESWWQAFLAGPRIEFLSQISLFCIGVLAAIAVDAQSWALVLLVAPVVAVYALLRQQNHLRQEAERARQASEASLAATQRVAHLGSWAWDVTAGAQEWSEEARRIFGIAPDAPQTTYETFLGSIDARDRDVVRLALQEALDQAKAVQIDYRIRLADGTERLVQHEADVHSDPAGRAIQMAGTIQDVTDRKDLEAQLADFNERERIGRELAKARRRLAESREDERLRLAWALHDGPVQDLLAISYQLAALQPAIDGEKAGDPPGAVLETTRRELLDVVGQLRGMIGELRPAGLADLGLAAALEGYVAGIQRRAT
ncbi:MAG TPA: PAS domain-containing protein, partial [Thermomicrobiales bacterium]|nr:PAS domain-containing protein [Thermomicrobiales bacterium]